MRLKRTLPPLLFATLAGAGLARAQETQEARFLDGGKPARGVQVSQFVNGQKTVLATTDADGALIPVDALGLGKGADEALSIPIDALGFGKGDEVAVWVKRCADGRVTEVILTPANADNPCPPEEGAQVGQRCGCERIGAFIWGGGPVDIDVTNRTVTQQLTSVPGWRENFTLGAKFNMSRWMNLEDVALMAPGATSVEADQWTPGVALLLETSPWGERLYFGVEGTYSMYDTRTQFTNQARIDEIGYIGQIQTGEIDYFSVGPYARVNLFSLDMGPMDLWFFGMAMAAYAWNRGDFTVNGSSESRTQETWRGEFGGGFYHFSTSMWGFMFQALYSMTGDDVDAEEHFRLGGGVILRPFRPLRFE
jgi:hypothetical protein